MEYDHTRTLKRFYSTVVHPPTISSYSGTPSNNFYTLLHLTTSYNKQQQFCWSQKPPTIRAYSLGLSRFLMFFDSTPKRCKRNSNIKKSFQISYISPVSSLVGQIPEAPGTVRHEFRFSSKVLLVQFCKY